MKKPTFIKRKVRVKEGNKYKEKFKKVPCLIQNKSQYIIGIVGKPGTANYETELSVQVIKHEWTEFLDSEKS